MDKQINSKGFTLVEMLVSVGLMSILFLYLYGSIGNVKVTNEPYIKRAKVIEYENKIFNLLSDDFLLMRGAADIMQYPKYDVVQFVTSNSLYQIQNPVVTYVVSKNEKALIRIETVSKYKINESFNIENMLYADVLFKDTLGFNVSFDKDYTYIFLRAQNYNPILLKLPKVS